jgi:predicted  nucleic acid-binding Zn-ribbon protein
MSNEELSILEWEQFQGNKPLKNEMDEFLQCDKDLIELQDKVEYFKTVIFTLEQILRSINSRTWDIKTAVEWHKFTNGMM